MEITGLTEDKIPPTAAYYTRVSTSRQENEQTIESQIAEIEKKIKEDGCILSSAYKYKDDGWSGSVLARPALDALRDACKNNLFNVLYVYDLGRLSRDFTSQLVLIEEIQNAGVKLISLHDINAENDEQSFARNVMGLFHDFEKKKIAERFRRGKMFKAGHGVLINGDALYGYTYIKKTENTASRYEINEDEMRIVRMIFRWVAIEGVSIRGVVMKLYRMGISPRKRKRDVWSKGPIIRMLKCRTYFDGIAYYNKSEAVESKHPTKDIKYKRVKKTSRKVRPFTDWIPFNVPKLFNDFFLFDKVQKILEDNKRYASKNRKYDYLLTGKTYCECGFRRVGDGYSKGSNHYYRSAARIYEFPKETECTCRGVNAVVLDKLYWAKFQEILTNPALLKKLAESWLKQQSDNSETPSKEIERIKEQIDRLKEEETRYVKIYAEGTIDSGQFEELIKGTRSKKKRFMEEIVEMEKKVNMPDTKKVDLDELCQEAQRVIKSQENNEKRQIIRDLVEKIVIKKGGDEVESWINIPLYQAHQMGYGIKRRNSRSSKCRKIYFV